MPTTQRDRRQLDYHAAKEREYRAARMAEREAAVSELRAAAFVLRTHGYTRGMIADVIDGALGANLRGRARLL